MRQENNTLTMKQRKQLLNIAARVQPFYKPAIPGEEIAFLVLMRICRDYCDPLVFSAVKGEERDQQLIERLKRFRIKYFEEV